MSNALEDMARALWDACPTVKPAWDQLGAVTKSVWLERAAAGETPRKTKPSTSGEQGVSEPGVGAVNVPSGVTDGAGVSEPMREPEAPCDGAAAPPTTELQGSLF